MHEPGFFERLALAFGTFFKLLFDASYAAKVKRADTPQLVDPTQPPRLQQKPASEPPVVKTHDHASALHLLAVLQRDGRFVDFLQEDIATYGDADVGAAVRVVHEGCRKVLNQYFALEPLRTESEGASVSVDKGFDPAAIRLTGNVTGEPPFKGALRHHGWRAGHVTLPPPPAGHDPKIVSPAEVEL